MNVPKIIRQFCAFNCDPKDRTSNCPVILPVHDSVEILGCKRLGTFISKAMQHECFIEILPPEAQQNVNQQTTKIKSKNFLVERL